MLFSLQWSPIEVFQQLILFIDKPNDSHLFFHRKYFLSRSFSFCLYSTLQPLASCTFICTSLGDSLNADIAVEVVTFLSVEVATFIGAALTVLAEIVAAVGNGQVIDLVLFNAELFKKSLHFLPFVFFFVYLFLSVYIIAKGLPHLVHLHAQAGKRKGGFLPPEILG